MLITNDEAKKMLLFAVKVTWEFYSSEWLKNKKAVIINIDNCFQNALNDALNYQNIRTNPERISNIKPFINQYNGRGIDFTSHQKDWKKFEENNKSISLNILYVPHNIKQIRTAHKSKYNYKRNKQVNFLMITNGEK